MLFRTKLRQEALTGKFKSPPSRSESTYTGIWQGRGCPATGYFIKFAAVTDLKAEDETPGRNRLCHARTAAARVDFCEFRLFLHRVRLPGDTVPARGVCPEILYSAACTLAREKENSRCFLPVHVRNTFHFPPDGGFTPVYYTGIQIQADMGEPHIHGSYPGTHCRRNSLPEETC